MAGMRQIILMFAVVALVMGCASGPQSSPSKQAGNEPQPPSVPTENPRLKARRGLGKGSLYANNSVSGPVWSRSSRKIEVPVSNPVHPQDVIATILHMYGLGHKLQFTSPQGRPIYMIENGRPIKELI